jgi:hypothetical protein
MYCTSLPISCLLLFLSIELNLEVFYNRTKRNNDTIVDSGKKSGTTNNIYVGKSPSEIDTQEEGRTEEYSDKRH